MSDAKYFQKENEYNLLGRYRQVIDYTQYRGGK